MKLADVEITLSQWATSRWTEVLTRAVLVSLPVMGTIFFLVWSAVQTDAARKVSSVEQNVVELGSAQAERDEAAKKAQVVVAQAFEDLNKKVDALADDQFTTRVDVGVIKRLVIELRDQGKAAALPLPSDPLPRPSTVAAASPIGRSPLLQ